jgi:hypothetical protein
MGNIISLKLENFNSLLTPINDFQFSLLIKETKSEDDLSLAILVVRRKISPLIVAVVSPHFSSMECPP